MVVCGGVWWWVVVWGLNLLQYLFECCFWNFGRLRGGVWWCMVVYGGVWWCVVDSFQRASKEITFAIVF